MSKGASASEAVSAEQAGKPLTDRMLQVIRTIGTRHFGERPRKIERLGGGRTNTVIGFRTSQGRYVFRTHDHAGKIHDYLKEQWAMDAARSVGIPTPTVLEVASLEDGRPYMIQEWVQGVEARELTDRMVPLREMGRLAARLHTIRTRGYGDMFNWSSNRLSQMSWRDYLLKGFDADGRLLLLMNNRMLSARQVRALRSSLRAAARWRKLPSLQHGDLRLKNLIVDPDSGRIRAVVDWESCLSSPPPYWDLSIALHELGIDEKEAFLEGYGLKPAALRKLAPFVRMFNVLNYASAVRCASSNRERERLEWLRLRLAAGLDLYEA